MAVTMLDDDTRRFGRLLHYAGVLIAVLCASVGYTLAYAPIEQSTSETEMRIDELLLSVQNGPMIREHHHRVLVELNAVKKRIAEVKRRVPPEPDAGEFLKEVTRLAGEEQLSLNNFHPEKPAVRDGYAELEVTLHGDGSFASICSFFDRLAKLKRLSKVKSLTLSASNGSNEYPMEATLIIYYGLKGKDVESGKGARRG